MGRTPCCNETGVRKGAWTADEDQKLIAYIQEHGEGGWRTLPQKAGLQRCGKSCRLRWANYLRPDIKRGEFSKAEDQLIIQLHASLGNRWSAIAKHLPKRTDNEIKNYWNTHLNKRFIYNNPIAPSPPPSNHNYRSTVSTSANLLNKVSAHLAQLHRIKNPPNYVQAIRTVLLNSTKTATNINLTSGSSNRDDNNDSDVEVLESVLKSSTIISSLSSSCGPSSSQLLNKMATKLVPLKNLDLIRHRLGVLSNQSMTSTSSYNIESSLPPQHLENIQTTLSKCESYESVRNLGNLREDNEGSEALVALDQAMSPCEVDDYLGNYEGEDGGPIFTNGPTNDENIDIVEHLTNMPLHNQYYNNTDYYCFGEGESNIGALDPSLNYWNDDFDLGNYAMQCNN